jgi:Cys-rich four helix bundle protein (predicted Tat secretion target)
MERRDFMKTGLAGAAVGLMGASLANAQDTSHAHHNGKAAVMPVASAELKKVAETAYDCERTATACIAECNRVLATGEASMAECQEAVLSMVSVCGATAANATMNLAPEKLLRQLVEVCASYCDYCADACEAHAEHYAECKNCMESCRECSKACKAYLEA